MAFRNRSAALAVILLTSVLFVISLVAGTDGAAAARYAVAQCGWHVGHDATWYDLSADKFSKSNYCQTPASADPFDGVHLINQTRSSTKTVGGTKFSTWRWQAPAGTGIVNVHGQRWQYLRDGFQHRLGGVASGGGFSPFLELSNTDSAKRDFSAGFWPFAAAFESRLVCYKPDDKLCQADGTVLSGVRALTITLDDSSAPTTQIWGGLTAPSWLRGVRNLEYLNSDNGAGLRFAETYIDGSTLTKSEMNCAKVMINGQWRGTKMRPCPTLEGGTHPLDTVSLADGTHRLQHCAIDFAGNPGCSGDRFFRVDNNAPAAPRGLEVEGGSTWRSTNGFNLTWTNPDQGAGSPIVAAIYRLAGPGGFQAGPWTTSGAGRIEGVMVPAAGEYTAKVWLADEAGNSDEGRESTVVMRFDDVAPSGYFQDPPDSDPGLIRVPVSDAHSGVSRARVSWRAQAGGEWHDIPGDLSEGTDPTLTARLPEDASRGPLVLRAVITDQAGNVAVTDRRANGSQMILRAPLNDRTALTVGLSTKSRAASGRVLAAYDGRARLSGRFTGVQAGGIGGAELEVTEIPFPGSRRSVTHRSVRTDSRGYFGVWLRRGPGRRVRVEFAGNRQLEKANSGVVEMRVQSRLTFKAEPRRLRTGDRVRFRGRVAARGAWHPTKGNMVQIQYFEEAARRWRPVTLARTDRNGRYRAAYRFRYITGLARIRLRALLLPSARFPYVRAASKPVTIRVRG